LFKTFNAINQFAVGDVRVPCDAALRCDAICGQFVGATVDQMWLTIFMDASKDSLK